MLPQVEVFIHSAGGTCCQEPHFAFLETSAWRASFMTNQTLLILVSPHLPHCFPPPSPRHLGVQEDHVAPCTLFSCILGHSCISKLSWRKQKPFQHKLACKRKVLGRGRKEPEEMKASSDLRKCTVGRMHSSPQLAMHVPYPHHLGPTSQPVGEAKRTRMGKQDPSQLEVK